MYGARIRELRKAKGWTMKQLGQKLDVAESTVSGYENEIRRPDMDVLVRLSELFHVSVDYLIGRGTEARETPTAYNVAIWNGKIEALTDEEANHLKNSLEMFRLWKANRSPDDSGR